MSDRDDRLTAELRALAAGTPPPPAGFVDAVMKQVALRPRPRRAWWAGLFAPRTVTFRFSLSQLLVGSALAAAGLIFALHGGRLGRPTGVAVQTVHGPPQPSAGPVRLRFALQARDARTVSLAGDFNGWRPDALPLERGPDGIWTVTVELPPGSWSYSFVVDGSWVEDPLAESYRADGFGGRNAVVRIGG